MKWCSTLLLFIWPMACFAQITIGDAIPAGEVAQARATLEKATPKTLALQVGEFEVLEPAKSLTSPLLWVISDDTVVQRMEIAAQQPLGLWMKRRGEVTPKLHQFPAKPFPWVILVGVKQGAATIQVIRNGNTAGSPPVVIDTLAVSVGGPAPAPPTPPVEDALTKALRAAWQQDQQAAKADRRWMQALAGIYEAASRDSLETVKTAGDLDQLLHAARQAAGIPDPDQALPNLRERLRQELLTQLSIPENGNTVPLTAPTRQTARQLFARIAHALEVIAP